MDARPREPYPGSQMLDVLCPWQGQRKASLVLRKVKRRQGHSQTSRNPRLNAAFVFSARKTPLSRKWLLRILKIDSG